MKILMVSPSFGIKNGGAENQLKILKKNLATYNNYKIINKSKTIFYPFGYLLKIFNEILKSQYDIIHIHTFNSPAWLMALISAIKNYKIIIKITLSGKGSRINNIQANFFYRFLFFIFFKRKNIFFHAITNDIKKKLINLGIKKSQIFFSPNGVEILNIKKDKNKLKKIIYFGRLISRKQVFQFLKFFLENQELMKKYSFSIFGNGPENLKIKNQINKARVTNIKLTKSISHDNIIHILKNYDVCINPSLNEGMSNSLLEAMSAGLVVVARDTKQNAEIIKNRQNGYLFKNDKDLISIFKNLRLNNKIILNAHAYVKKNHDIKIIAKRFDNFYKKLKI